MQHKELALLFEAGNLTAASIVRYPMGNQWALQFKRKGGSPVVMSSQRSEVRLFKTLDSAFSAAKQLGFLTATITKSL